VSYDEVTGHKNWQATIVSAGTPVIVGNLVIVSGGPQGATPAQVYAVNADTGAIVWQHAGDAGGDGVGTDGTNAYFSVAPDSGNIFQLVAVNIATGNTVWATDVDGGPSGFTVVGGRLLYLLSRNHLVARNTADGSLLWAVDRAANFTAFRPVVANHIVYVGGGGTSYNGFDAATGEQLFTVASLDGGISPTIVNGTIYWGTGSDIERLSVSG
jgi:outer membrane protein assembly factor BamB